MYGQNKRRAQFLVGRRISDFRARTNIDQGCRGCKKIVSADYTDQLTTSLASSDVTLSFTYYLCDVRNLRMFLGLDDVGGHVSQGNIELANSIYKAFNQGDFAAVLDVLDPRIEWVAADSSPLADRSPYHGLDEVRDGVFERIAAGFPGLTIRVDELLDAGDKVVMLGVYLGVFKPTGKRIQAQVAHIWTIAAGKAVKFQQYTDTYRLAEAVK